VVVTADEPAQYSSQNEQDNRNYAKAAKIPMLEPADSQECLDMAKLAFEISETFDIPVMIRMTTRVCHSKSLVEVGERQEVAIKPYEKRSEKYVTVPANAKKLRVTLEDRLARLKDYAEKSPLNVAEYHDTAIGVIASGDCYFYAKEVFGEDASYLKLGMTYPIPTDAIANFCMKVDKLYIVEENDPYIEEAVRMLGYNPIGKDLFPFCGEMTPDVLREALFGEHLPSPEYDESKVVNRPPTLCAGCPHRGFFYEISRRKNVVVTGDIGCYTLGSAKPFNALDSTICMGASISMGHGAQKIFNRTDSNTRVVAVLGDSTFFHTGINSLMNVAYNRSNTVNVILDNRITGMTGHQQNPGTGFTASGDPTSMIDLETLVKALGFEHVRTIDPNNLIEVKETLDEFLALDAPSVIITRWPCALKKFSADDKQEFPAAFRGKLKVDQNKCIGCRICMRAGCPALSFDKAQKKARIDMTQCLGCQVCAQICPKQAIVKEDM